MHSAYHTCTANVITESNRKTMRRLGTHRHSAGRCASWRKKKMMRIETHGKLSARPRRASVTQKRQRGCAIQQLNAAQHSPPPSAFRGDAKRQRRCNTPEQRTSHAAAQQKPQLRSTVKEERTRSLAGCRTSEPRERAREHTKLHRRTSSTRESACAAPRFSRSHQPALRAAHQHRYARRQFWHSSCSGITRAEEAL